jgi:hypothetical protein
MKFTHVALATALMLTPAAMLAQMSANPPTLPPTPAPAAAQRPTTGKTIQQREANQQARIAQGIKSGELKPGEAAHLEHQEAGINREERGMRSQNNGKLSAADRKILTRQQNQESRRIARQKHDGPGK